MDPVRGCRVTIAQHMPIIVHPTAEWEPKRTDPCQITCACGWATEVMRDQTTAEWVHGQHLADVGLISGAQIQAEYAALRMAQGVEDDAGGDVA